MEGGSYVSSTLFEKNGHLTKISLKGLKEDSLSDNELVIISEHICHCEGCADALADSFDDNELAEVPPGFEEEILRKIKKKKESNIQFVFYSLRVAMAASIALMFVFSNALNFVANTKIKTLDVNPISLSTINTINKSLNRFSEQIINMEVFNNEKEKK
jgi:hypothetical protein